MVFAEAELLVKRFWQLRNQAQNPAASQVVTRNVQGEHNGQSELIDGFHIVISSLSRRSCVTMQQERTLLPGYKWGRKVHLSGMSFLLNENM